MLRFDSDTRPLILHKRQHALPNTDEARLLIQDTLILKGYPQSLIEKLMVISCDEECVIIQIPHEFGQDICLDTLRSEIEDIIERKYEWRSSILITADGI